MPAGDGFTLGKEERVAGRTLVESLFKGGGSRSMSYYPLRVVYRLVDRQQAPVRILVSVPKRSLKRAVWRNRVKRQVREAYRLQKHLLDAVMEGLPDKTLALSFIWHDDKIPPSREVAHRVRRLLIRIGESL